MPCPELTCSAAPGSSFVYIPNLPIIATCHNAPFIGGQCCQLGNGDVGGEVGGVEREEGNEDR